MYVRIAVSLWVWGGTLCYLKLVEDKTHCRVGLEGGFGEERVVEDCASPREGHVVMGFLLALFLGVSQRSAALPLFRWNWARWNCWEYGVGVPDGRIDVGVVAGGWVDVGDLVVLMNSTGCLTPRSLEVFQDLFSGLSHTWSCAGWLSSYLLCFGVLCFRQKIVSTVWFGFLRT